MIGKGELHGEQGDIHVNQATKGRHGRTSIGHGQRREYIDSKVITREQRPHRYYAVSGGKGIKPGQDPIRIAYDMTENREPAAVIGVIQRSRVVGEVEEELRVSGVGIAGFSHSNRSVCITQMRANIKLVSDVPEVRNIVNKGPRRGEEVGSVLGGCGISTTLDNKSRLQPMKEGVLESATFDQAFEILHGLRFITVIKLDLDVPKMGVELGECAGLHSVQAKQELETKEEENEQGRVFSSFAHEEAFVAQMDANSKFQTSRLKAVCLFQISHCGKSVTALHKMFACIVVRLILIQEL